MKFFLALGLILVLFLTACEDSETDATKLPSSTDTPETDLLVASPTPETDLGLATPTLDTTLRLSLETQYDELQAAQIAIENVWSNLQKGETVVCSDELPFLPEPQNYEGEHPLNDDLYTAAVFLDTAYSLWEAECLNPRSQPPADIINQGLLAALSAGDNLQTVFDVLQGNE